MSSPSQSAHSYFSWKEALDHLAHLLPSQGPIQHFIHHNTLHAFQDQSFFDGVLRAAHFFGARSLLDPIEFEAFLKKGVIQASALDAVLLERFPDAKERQLWKERLEKTRSLKVDAAKGWVQTGLRSRWKEEAGFDLDARVFPLLFRLLGGFLDQGVALWRMPTESTHASFLEAVLLLSEGSFFSLVPGGKKAWLEDLRKHAGDDGLNASLKELVGSSHAHERYVLEMLLSHPGWSGLVRQIEERPDLLMNERKISLRDLVAVEIAIERAVLRDAGIHSPLLKQSAHENWPVDPQTPVASEMETVQEIWQLALERTFAQPILEKTIESLGTGSGIEKKKPSQSSGFLLFG